HAFSPFVKDPVTGLQTNADGGYITDLQLGSDGNLYGVTDNGGSQGQGTMFRINPDGSFTTLNTFNFNITLPGLIADNEFIQG
ncbi:choice-of-anchor tandem repeat GloVer-containing protein, partial [Acinetobacter baumannii]